MENEGCEREVSFVREMNKSDVIDWSLLELRSSVRENEKGWRDGEECCGMWRVL